MISLLTQPLAYDFMVRGMLAGVLVGITCAVIGCYVVLRSMAFLGDALAHAILPGVAIAYLLGGNLLVGALIAAVIVALGIGFITRRGAIKEDTAIGIVFAAALALGVALISTIRTYAVDLSHILFGNVLGVSSQDLILILVLSIAVLTAVIILYRPFLVVSFDPILAKTLRMPAELLRFLLLFLLAVTIVISMQTVGIGLVAAMLVTPAAAAYLFTRRLPAMMAVAAGIGVLSNILGFYLSFYFNLASGAAIVLVATSVFLLAFLFAPQKGLIWQRLKGGSHA
jgi:manganese/iron transport system permease protein